MTLLMRALIAPLLALCLLLAAPVLAQTDTSASGPDYARWESLASRAEAALESGEASIEQIGALRSSIVEWRDRFQVAQNVNEPRIATLKDQLAALGPDPAEGEAEAEDVAGRRKALNDQLAELQAPRLTAVEAFSRADSLIRQIDEAERQRQANALARLSPSPLNPSSWAEALRDGEKFVEGVVSDSRQHFSDLTSREAMVERAPVVVGYLLTAVLLLGFGRRWVDSLPGRLGPLVSAHNRAVIAFVLSLGQILIPLVGAFLLVGALLASNFFGAWTQPLLLALPGAGLIFFSGRWLARQLFPRRAIAYDALSLPAEKRDNLRRYAIALALLSALHYVFVRAGLPLAGFYQLPEEADRLPLNTSDASAAVWHFPLILLAGLLLHRLGNILRQLTRWNLAETPKYRVRILTLAGSLSRFVALLAVIAAVIGYVSAANAMVWPWLLSLWLVGLLVLLQDFTADLFEMAMRGREGAREGLAPVLIGFGLVLLSLPLFALIWGAKTSDLAEVWMQARQGFSLGGITLSPAVVLTFLIVFAVGYALTRLVQGALRNTILPKTRLDAGGQNAVVSGLGYVGIFLSALLAITSAGIDLSSIAIVAGALSVGIGFGLQNIVSNFVSGIILLIERPISVGDWIEAGGQQGIVKRISVRSTSVETFDKTEVIVPNADLVSQPVTNWTRGNATGRIIIPVGVAYGTDTRKVQRILTEIIENQPVVTIDPAPAVLFRGFGADSMDFEIRAILSDVNAGLGTTSEVLHQIAARFAEEGIEIPFAQRDIWLRNPETLRSGSPAGAPPAPEAPPQPQTPPDIPEPPRSLDPALGFAEDSDGGGDGGGDD